MGIFLTGNIRHFSEDCAKLAAAAAKLGVDHPGALWKKNPAATTVKAANSDTKRCTTCWKGYEKRELNRALNSDGKLSAAKSNASLDAAVIAGTPAQIKALEAAVKSDAKFAKRYAASVKRTAKLVEA